MSQMPEYLKELLLQLPLAKDNLSLQKDYQRIKLIRSECLKEECS